MTKQQNKGNTVAIITMFFMFAMVSFVTNMAAPFGNIWKTHYEWSGMLGNMMNFAAYLIMGIPAGKLLSRIGYKKTALVALGTGFVGMLVQFLSSFMAIGISALFVYLLGAFICGFCVCMLNTVVNPMLNTLGGGGNRGNQLIQTGGACNSLVATLTPLLAGAMIGTITKNGISFLNPYTTCNCNLNIYPLALIKVPLSRPTFILRCIIPTNITIFPIPKEFIDIWRIFT